MDSVARRARRATLGASARRTGSRDVSGSPARDADNSSEGDVEAKWTISGNRRVDPTPPSASKPETRRRASALPTSVARRRPSGVPEDPILMAHHPAMTGKTPGVATRRRKSTVPTKTPTTQQKVQEEPKRLVSSVRERTPERIPERVVEEEPVEERREASKTQSALKQAMLEMVQRHKQQLEASKKELEVALTAAAKRHATELEKEIQKRREAEERADKARHEMEERVEAAEGELKLVRGKLQEVQETVEVRETDWDGMRREVEARAEAAEDEVDLVRRKMRTLEEEVQAECERREQAEEQKQILAKQLDDQSQELRNLESQIAIEHANSEQLEAHVEEARAEAEALRAKVEAELHEAQVQVREAQEQAAEAAEDASSAQAEAMRERDRAQRLQSRMEKQDIQLQKTRRWATKLLVGLAASSTAQRRQREANSRLRKSSSALTKQDQSATKQNDEEEDDSLADMIDVTEQEESELVALLGASVHGWVVTRDQHGRRRLVVATPKPQPRRAAEIVSGRKIPSRSKTPHKTPVTTHARRFRRGSLEIPRRLQSTLQDRREKLVPEASGADLRMVLDAARDPGQSRALRNALERVGSAMDGSKEEEQQQEEMGDFLSSTAKKQSTTFRSLSRLGRREQTEQKTAVFQGGKKPSEDPRALSALAGILWRREVERLGRRCMFLEWRSVVLERRLEWWKHQKPSNGDDDDDDAKSESILHDLEERKKEEDVSEVVVREPERVTSLNEQLFEERAVRARVADELVEAQLEVARLEALVDDALRENESLRAGSVRLEREVSKLQGRLAGELTQAEVDEDEQLAEDEHQIFAETVVSPRATRTPGGQILADDAPVSTPTRGSPRVVVSSTDASSSKLAWQVTRLRSLLHQKTVQLELAQERAAQASDTMHDMRAEAFAAKGEAKELKEALSSDRASLAAARAEILQLQRELRVARDHALDAAAHGRRSDALDVHDRAVQTPMSLQAFVRSKHRHTEDSYAEAHASTYAIAVALCDTAMSTTSPTELVSQLWTAISSEPRHEHPGEYHQDSSSDSKKSVLFLPEHPPGLSSLLEVLRRQKEAAAAEGEANALDKAREEFSELVHRHEQAAIEAERRAELELRNVNARLTEARKHAHEQVALASAANAKAVEASETLQRREKQWAAERESLTDQTETESAARRRLESALEGAESERARLASRVARLEDEIRTLEVRERQLRLRAEGSRGIVAEMDPIRPESHEDWSKDQVPGRYIPEDQHQPPKPPKRAAPKPPTT